MLRGQRPFDGDSPLEVMESIKRAEAPDLEGLAPDLAALVRRCLGRDPALRFADDAALLDALARCRAARPANALDLARFLAEEG